MASLMKTSRVFITFISICSIIKIVDTLPLDTIQNESFSLDFPTERIYSNFITDKPIINIGFDMILREVDGDFISIHIKLSEYDIIIPLKWTFNRQGDVLLTVRGDINAKDILMKDILTMPLFNNWINTNISIYKGCAYISFNSNRTLLLSCSIYKKPEKTYSKCNNVLNTGCLLFGNRMKGCIKNIQVTDTSGGIEVGNTLSKAVNTSYCENGQGKDNISMNPSTTTSNTFNRNSHKNYKTPPTPTECRFYIWIIATFLICSIFWIIVFNRNAIKDKFQRKREETSVDGNSERVLPGDTSKSRSSEVNDVIISEQNGFYGRIKRAFKRGKRTSSGNNNDHSAIYSPVSHEETPVIVDTENVSIVMPSDVPDQVFDDIISDPNRDQSDSPPTTQNI